MSSSSMPFSPEQKRSIYNNLFLDSQSLISIDTARSLELIGPSRFLKSIDTLSIASQERAVTLIKSPKFQDWITSTTSRAFLVNGNIPFKDEQRQSALSYVCAKLGIEIRTMTGETTYVLGWFCGRHTDAEKDNTTLHAEMLHHLHLQLMAQLLHSPNPPSFESDNLRNSDVGIKKLCDVLSSLVEGLSGRIKLFVIIDRIEYYEKKEPNDCSLVMNMLLELTRKHARRGEGCLVKVLVTTPTRSGFKSLFGDENVMNLNEYIRPGRGFSEEDWYSSVSRFI